MPETPAVITEQHEAQRDFLDRFEHLLIVAFDSGRKAGMDRGRLEGALSIITALGPHLSTKQYLLALVALRSLAGADDERKDAVN